jgi:hypothetical protein
VPAKLPHHVPCAPQWVNLRHGLARHSQLWSSHLRYSRYHMRPCGASCSRRRRCCSASLRLRGTINIKLRLGGLACSAHRWRSDDNFVPDHVDPHLSHLPIPFSHSTLTRAPLIMFLSELTKGQKGTGNGTKEQEPAGIFRSRDSVAWRSTTDK